MKLRRKTEQILMEDKHAAVESNTSFPFVEETHGKDGAANLAAEENVPEAQVAVYGGNNGVSNAIYGNSFLQSNFQAHISWAKINKEGLMQCYMISRSCVA
jgi:hypothetical protein